MKQKEKSWLTKTKVLQAARDLFSKKGYQKTTMADILQLSEVSKGALYHQFDSKESILQSLLQEESDRVFERLNELVCRQNESAKKRIVTFILGQLSDDSGLRTVNWVEKIPYGLLWEVRQSLTVIVDGIANLIQQGNQQGEFNCLYLKETASAFVLLVDIWMDTEILEMGLEEVYEKVDYISHFLELSGVKLFTNQELDELKDQLKVVYEGK